MEWRLLPYEDLRICVKNRESGLSACAGNRDLMQGLRLRLSLGQLDFQYAVLEFCRGLGIINTGNVEGTGHLAVAALPTQIVTCLVLLVIVFLPLSGKGQVVVIVAQGYILLFEAGKIGGKFIGCAVVFDIDFEAKAVCGG